jgi:hypothetical protein
MPIFDEQGLRELRREERRVRGKYAELLFAYLAVQFSNPLAKEIAHQGFARRLKVLAYCINTVFTRLPPWSDDVPKDEVRLECEVCVQAFVFNVFGCIDNLANMWVKERNITRSNGKEIPPLLIGLGEKCKAVRDSLSDDLQRYLSSDGMLGWLAYLEDYRHALAHRIPLYIPPHAVKQSNAQAYQDLETRKIEATRRLDLDEHDRLEGEQMKLCVFQPYIKHSWGDDKPPLRFHERMLGDYATVVDLGQRMLEELKRPKS